VWRKREIQRRKWGNDGMGKCLWSETGHTTPNLTYMLLAEDCLVFRGTHWFWDATQSSHYSTDVSRCVPVCPGVCRCVPVCASVCASRRIALGQLWTEFGHPPVHHACVHKLEGVPVLKVCIRGSIGCPGFDSRRYQIFRVAVGLERGPLSPCEDK
jgi:hypothetical protein